MATSNSFYCSVGSDSVTLSSVGDRDTLHYSLVTNVRNLLANVSISYTSNGDASCTTRVNHISLYNYKNSDLWVRITNPNGSTSGAYDIRHNTLNITPNWDTTWSKGTSQAQTTKSLVITFYTNSACTNVERTWTFNIQGTIGAKTKYTNTYYPNGGNGSAQTQDHYHGSAFTTKTTSAFSRTNYALSKWNTTASGSGTNYTANTSYTVDSNLSLYAQWTQVYASPQVTINKAYRCDANGDADDEGTYAAVECSFSIWNTSGNAVNTTDLPTCTVNSVSQTASSGDPSTTINRYSSSLTTSGNWLTGKCRFVVAAGMSLNSSYAVSVTVKDTKGGTTISGASTSSNTGTKTSTIGTAFYTIDVREGGHGICFGGVSTGDWFEVDMPFRYKGSEFGCKVLWSGTYGMLASHTANLSENVSAQLSGIVLCWSGYYSGGAQNTDWVYTFVPKKHVSSHNTTGVCTFMSTPNFTHVCSKYVYVSDGSVSGNDYNWTTGTSNGVTYDNKYWVLRYVIGV